MCLLSLVFIDVHVILLDKILISYCLNDKNITICPFGALCVVPKISFTCELTIKRWRIEVVEAQVDDSVSSVRIHADRGCHLCNL